MSNAANNRYVIVDKAWLDKIIGYAQRQSEIAEFSVKEAIGCDFEWGESAFCPSIMEEADHHIIQMNHD